QLGNEQRARSCDSDLCFPPSTCRETVGTGRNAGTPSVTTRNPPIAPGDELQAPMITPIFPAERCKPCSRGTAVPSGQLGCALPSRGDTAMHYDPRWTDDARDGDRG